MASWAQIQHFPYSWGPNRIHHTHGVTKKAPKLPASNTKTHNLKRMKDQSAKLHDNVMGKEKQYWLLKTEPGEWSWEDQSANGGVSKWDGVKNKQAQKYMKSMSVHDMCFFYHSGSKARRVVGVVRVAREWYSVDEEGKDGAVDVEAVGEMRRPVDLAEMKRDVALNGFVLFRQSRLSVVPVEERVWLRVCELGGGFHGDGVVEEE